MRMFAFYLPQFHEIPENDKWWGKGFTEWTNVKSAKPLYKGHVHPKHPLNNEYYNLLDKSIVEKQTETMRRYGVNGFIYYHYYFEGKLLLEKPAENLLQWKDINQHFFFCWANHAWIQSKGNDSTVLMPMNYGTEGEWERHFQYLLPFFKDPRYEKRKNKPVFMLFQSKFNEKKEMMQYFNKRCKQEGFDGLCLIESYHGDIASDEFIRDSSDVMEYLFYREPTVTNWGYSRTRGIVYRVIHKMMNELRKKDIIHYPWVVNGKDLMNYKIQNEKLGEKVAHGIFFEWDNTPRHKQRGYVITPYEKKDFMMYMDLIKKEDYLFINAWNEWAEGMILEPTEENGDKYLGWIKEWNDAN